MEGKGDDTVNQLMQEGLHHSVSLLCVSRSKRKCIRDHYLQKNVHEDNPCWQSNKKTMSSHA